MLRRRLELDIERDAAQAVNAAAGFDGENYTSAVATESAPTYDEMVQAIKDLPMAPKYRARAEWRSHLEDQLSAAHAKIEAERTIPQHGPFIHSWFTLPEIEIVEKAPYRWMIDTKDEYLIHTDDGMFSIKKPPPLEFDIPLYDLQMTETMSWVEAMINFPSSPQPPAFIGWDYGIGDSYSVRTKIYRRPSRGMRKHVRRQKAFERRGTWPA